jgi:hypothetical protein
VKALGLTSISETSKESFEAVMRRN